MDKLSWKSWKSFQVKTCKRRFKAQMPASCRILRSIEREAWKPLGAIEPRLKAEAFCFRSDRNGIQNEVPASARPRLEWP